MKAVAKYKRIFKIHIMSIVKGPQHYNFLFSDQRENTTQQVTVSSNIVHIYVAVSCTVT